MADETTAGESLPADETPATETEPLDANEPQDAPDPSERTFTQAEINAFLARQKRELLAGAENLSELREKAKRLDEIEEQSKTELEREREARERAEAEITRIREEANQAKLLAAIEREATRQKALKPEHIHRLIDLDTITFGDDGQVVGAEDAVKAFLESNPEYVGRPASPAGSADQGARPVGPRITREQLKDMSREQIIEAQKAGRLDHLLAGT